MVWLYRSPIPVGRRGVISSIKLFLPAFHRVEEGGGVGVGTLWSVHCREVKTTDISLIYTLFWEVMATLLICTLWKVRAAETSWIRTYKMSFRSVRTTGFWLAGHRQGWFNLHLFGHWKASTKKGRILKSASHKTHKTVVVFINFPLRRKTKLL